MNKTVAIYARVSTSHQTVASQLNELHEFIKRSGWTLYREFIDEGYTGANTKRPAFGELMAEARKRKFNILLVWKLDRLSRSLKDLINTLDELGHLNIDFISYTNNLDTSTPTGKLIFQIIGAVSEFEKDLIKERVKAGLNNARKNGKQLGRPPIPPETITKIEALKKERLSNRQIAKQLNISEKTVRNFQSTKR